MGRFSRHDHIFEDEIPFREEYTPPTLQEREEELDEYARALSPIIRGYSPKNIFLYGKTGVGKTVATKHILDELQEDAEEYDDVSLTVITVSCRNLSSSYQVAIQLVNKLREETNKEKIASTGYPSEQVYEYLFDEMDAIGGTVLFVLDEIDNIGTDDSLLYRIPRAKTNGDISSCDPGIIGISNDYKFKEGLSPEVLDTLCDEELNFAPYDANELRSILSQRAQNAFKDGVLDDSVLPLAAARAAQDSGSARQALRLLYKAGELARDDQSKLVTKSHVQKAQGILEMGKVKEGIRDSTSQDHVILCSILDLALDNETPTRTRVIHERYEDFAEHVNVDPLVRRRMYDRVSELLRRSFLDMDVQNDGYRSGRYYEYELAVSFDTVLEALRDVERVQPLVERLERKRERIEHAKRKDNTTQKQTKLNNNR